MAKGYWIVRVVVKDEEAVKRYAAGNHAIFEKLGGRYLVPRSQCRANRATGRERRLTRFRESMKQSLQLLFTCLLSFQPTAQPSHYRRYARLSSYLSAAIIQRCGQEAPVQPSLARPLDHRMEIPESVPLRAESQQLPPLERLSPQRWRSWLSMRCLLHGCRSQHSGDSPGRARVIPCEPKIPASAWSDALRAWCRRDRHPGRLYNKTASTQIGAAQGQSVHCTCRIGVCQYALAEKVERTSAHRSSG
jgi:hypothetical protein